MVPEREAARGRKSPWCKLHADDQLDCSTRWLSRPCRARVTKKGEPPQPLSFACEQTLCITRHGRHNGVHATCGIVFLRRFSYFHRAGVHDVVRAFMTRGGILVYGGITPAPNVSGTTRTKKTRIFKGARASSPYAALDWVGVHYTEHI